MSNRCDPPGREVDALGAGASGISAMWGSLKSYGTMIAPFMIWYYLIPALTGLMFTKQMMEVESKKVIEATEEMEEHTITEMVEVEAPISWPEYFTKLILFGLIGFTFLLLTIYTSQEGLLYVPDQPIKYIEQNPPRYQSPTERGMTYEEVWLKTKDNLKLQGWFMYQPENANKCNTIIFLHENAGNIGLRMDWFALVYHELKVNILGVSYRGFSRSQGHPEQEGILTDVEAMLEYAKSEPRINNKRVFILGRSLGGAVAVHTQARLAQQGDEWIKGLILENTFTNISEMADRLFPFLKAVGNFKEKMLRLNWDSKKQIEEVTKPIFLITGSKDMLVPHEMTLSLEKAAKKSKDKELWVIEDGEHNNTFLKAGPLYTMRLAKFMAKCLGEEPPTSIPTPERTAEEVTELIEGGEDEKKQQSVDGSTEDLHKVHPTQEDELAQSSEL